MVGLEGDSRSFGSWRAALRWSAQGPTVAGMRWVPVLVIAAGILAACGSGTEIAETPGVEESAPVTRAPPPPPSSSTTTTSSSEQACPGTVQDRLDAVLEAVVDPETGFPVIDPRGPSPTGVPVLCSLADAREFVEDRPAPAPLGAVLSEDVETRVLEVSAVGDSFEVTYEGEWHVFAGPLDTTGSTVRYVTVTLAAETGMHTRITASQSHDG